MTLAAGLFRRLLHVGALAAITLTAGCGGEPMPADFAARSNAAADQFQSRLQSELRQALVAGGPVGAVAVCAEAAPVIAADVSDQSGLDVRRISSQPRNPGAATDMALGARLQSLAANPLDDRGRPATMQWTEGDGTTATHFSMRAVVMQDQPCSACHGSNIAPSVRAAIAQRYPGDRATGYRAGELRGAILTSSPRRGENDDRNLR